MEEKLSPFKLKISPDLRKIMQDRMILEEDLQLVIQHAETSGEKMLDPATGRIIAHYRPACVTYWAEYSSHENDFVLHNAYSHRMQVVEEAGW